MDNNTETSTNLALRVSRKSIIINTALMILKLIAGFIGHSTALVSDGIHTATDIVSTVIVVIGINVSSKGEDKKYNYGRDRYESVAAVVVAIILIIVGGSIGFSSVNNILNIESILIPGRIALVGAAASIGLKEYMYRYTHDAALKTKSDALMADAWHHRSDALSSIGSLVGVIGSRLGFTILDPIAGLLIAFLIIKAGWDIFIDATEKLTDAALSKEKVDKMINVIEEIDYVENLDSIKTRKFGSQSYVDVSIGVCAYLPLHEAHDIATEVHDKLEESFDSIIHVMVHVNPFDCGIEDHECRYPHMENRYSDKCQQMKKTRIAEN